MNNFQKLAQLSRDIELLENAGKFDAAEVLQRKFLKEAQAVFNYPSTEKNYNPSGYAAPGTAYTDPEAAVTNFQTYAQGGTVAPNAATQPAGAPYSDPEAAVTNFQTAFQGLGSATSQPQATTGDTANQMQAQNTMPAESPIYQQAINQIAKLLQAKNPMSRTMAQSIYDQTIVQFKDPKRKQAFANQFQRLMSTNFPGQSLKS
jgi:hypothetical protein